MALSVIEEMVGVWSGLVGFHMKVPLTGKFASLWNWQTLEVPDSSVRKLPDTRTKYRK